MSYTTGTTHYNLPQTVGSDKRDWSDTNEAFAEVDSALYSAAQGAAQAALDIASINSEIQTITGKQTDDEADISTLQGKVSTLETTVGNHTTEIGDVRRDLQDNIESLREDTATSTHAYEIGDYFYYNDVLFKATAQIAIGATIVPNTNCTGVTVMDELKNVSPTPGAVAAEDVSYNNTTSGLTATDVQAAIDELAADTIQVINITSATTLSDISAAVDAAIANNKSMFVREEENFRDFVLSTKNASTLIFASPCPSNSVWSYDISISSSGTTYSAIGSSTTPVTFPTAGCKLIIK